jgi:elongation factor P hydroxylase
MTEDAKVDKLISLFNHTFESFETRLVRGEHEPIYLPKNSQRASHQVVFAHGYFSSALHEIAHWCIAGTRRRQLEDYGYWYAPDGRDEQQQAEFQKVEVKPQAIEWAFSLAADHKFRVSTDNLNGAEPDTVGFTHAVKSQLLTYIRDGFPPRAETFINALHQAFSTPRFELLDIQKATKQITQEIAA